MAVSECQQDSNSGWLGCVVRKMAIGDEHEDGDIGGLCRHDDDNDCNDDDGDHYDADNDCHDVDFVCHDVDFVCHDDDNDCHGDDNDNGPLRSS